MRLLGSIAIHALLAVLLISIHRTHEESGAPSRVELVDVAIEPPREESPVTHVGAPSGSADIGGPVAPGRAAPRSARRVAMPRPSEHRVEPIGDRNRELGDDLRVEPTGDRDTGLTDGAGLGDSVGGGSGLGLGDGRGLSELLPVTPSVPAPPPAPPAPRISRARPARLVYPSRQTQVDADRLFIAEVIVDTEGFVVGAKLARGSGGPRDGEAGAAVWRFRYDPALDDDGLPIRSTVRQAFAVAW